MNRLPRWYRNGLACWAAVGAPFWMFALFSWFDQGRVSIEPPDDLTVGRVVFLGLICFPITGAIVALLLAIVHRVRRPRRVAPTQS